MPEGFPLAAALPASCALAGAGTVAKPRLASPAGLAFFGMLMDLATARSHIQAALDRMRVAYMRPVFDEWALLSISGEPGGIAAYAGPRPDAFRRNFAEDVEPLRGIAAGRAHAEGDIEFADDATRTRFDAFMKVGPASFLVLNNTTKTMAEIRADGKWLNAQAVLFDLGEKFRADPLE